MDIGLIVAMIVTGMGCIKIMLSSWTIHLNLQRLCNVIKVSAMINAQDQNSSNETHKQQWYSTS